jgi:tetratricopeptide (TPR) repeat protein
MYRDGRSAPQGKVEMATVKGQGRSHGAQLRCIVFVDAVNSTQELKTLGHATVGRKIAALRDFAEFCFVFRMKGEFIGELGDGFLILCPPDPPRVLAEAFVLLDFVRAHNHRSQPPADLNVRIAVHFGLVQPPTGRNYLDANISLTSRLEGTTPPNAICCSSVLHDIVAPTLREYHFTEAGGDLKGFGETKYYILSRSNTDEENVKRSERLSFYLGTINALGRAGDWKAVAATCEQGLKDFKDNPEFWYQFACANLVLKNDDEMVRGFKECIRLNYKLGESLGFIGNRYEEVGDIDAAVNTLNRAVEVDPKHFHAMTTLAEIYAKRGSLKEARLWTRRALKLAPKYYTPIAMLAALDIGQANTTILERAIAKIPEHNLVPFHLEVRGYLKELSKRQYLRSIEQILVSVFGKDWKRRSLLADRALMERNKQEREERELAEGPKVYLI